MADSSPRTGAYARLIARATAAGVSEAEVRAYIASHRPAQTPARFTPEQVRAYLATHRPAQTSARFTAEQVRAFRAAHPELRSQQTP